MEQPKDQQLESQSESQSENSSQYLESMIAKEESAGAKKQLLIEDAISFGWETFKKNYKFLLLLGLCYWGIYIAESIVKEIAKGTPAQWIVMLAGFVLELVVGIGLVKVALKVSRGQHAELKEIFGDTKYLLNYFLGFVMYMVVVLAGFLLLIVPGVIWMIKYGAFQYLILDKNLSPRDALRESGKITYGYKKKLFLLGLVMLLIVLGGALLFGVGLLVAMPVNLLAATYVYRFLIGEEIQKVI